MVYSCVTSGGRGAVSSCTTSTQNTPFDVVVDAVHHYRRCTMPYSTTMVGLQWLPTLSQSFERSVTVLSTTGGQRLPATPPSLGVSLSGDGP